jgi:hypothetical protein
MNNSVYRDVNRDVKVAVTGAVFRWAYAAVFLDIERAVYGAVDEAVYEAVYAAVWEISHEGGQP